MLSVLIVNWNTRELLRACLASIASHPPTKMPFEVIVVDNASTDGSAEMVPESFPWVRLVASATNTGYAKGNNLAFSRATGEFLLTLNPDTEVFDRTFDAALEAMSRHPKVGCVGARQIYAKDGSTQRSVRGFPSVRGILGQITGLARRLGGAWDSYELTRFDYAIEQPAPQPMGTFLLFRREALEDIGDPKSPFDESFPIFFNEVDLLYRLQKSGWECLYAPSVEILHHGGESTKQVRKSMIWESHRSLARFFRKHHGTGLAKVGLPFLSAVLYTAAFVRAKGHDAGFRA
jgi:N-acetylglucosaminyl-diphospho-decaprenol L-rhamnosyltransferase